MNGLLIMAAVSAAFTAMGVRAYQGASCFRVVTAPSPTAYFASAWFWGAGILITLVWWAFELLGDPTNLLLLPFAVLGAVGWIIGLVGVVWMPPRLTPRWYRDWVLRGCDPGEFADARYLTRLERWTSARRSRALRRKELSTKDKDTGRPHDGETAAEQTGDRAVHGTGPGPDREPEENAGKDAEESQKVRYVVDDVSGGAIRLSAAWSQVEAAPGTLMLTLTGWGETVGKGTPPNVTLTTTAAGPDVEDVTVLGIQAMDLAREQLDDVHLVAFDYSPP